jgi:hypothetical protein
MGVGRATTLCPVECSATMAMRRKPNPCDEAGHDAMISTSSGYAAGEVRLWLRAQPVHATPSTLTDKGLKPMAFLRRGLATTRDRTSTSEMAPANSMTWASYRCDKHFPLRLLNLPCVASTS